jgi:transcriptional regulator with XRE-family HTH domain
LSRGVFNPSEMSPLKRSDPMPPAAQAALARMAVDAGRQLRDERLRRGWTLRTVAARAGVGLGVAHAAEAGTVVALESYARLATALNLRPAFDLAGSRFTGRASAHGQADLVHAAMGELELSTLQHPEHSDRTTAIDEPYQHYQFAGRADVLAWDADDLLHIENRTRFPDLQEAAGAYNAKRRYLAVGIADRAGIGPRGWRSVTHVMACLWSAEALHAIRIHRASFAALCPDPPDALLAWLAGEPPPPGVTSTLVVLDPLVPFGSRRRTIAAVVEPPRLDPRYRGYAEAAEALRHAR